MLVTQAKADPLSSERIRFFSMVAVADLVLLGAAAILRQRWIAQLTIVGVLLVAKKVFDARDPVGARILAFAAIQGVGLLWWDWLHIQVLHTLAYPHEGPFVALSPLFMPFAWTITLVPIFCLAVFLSDRVNVVRAVLVATAVGTAFFAGSEMLAVHAGWWSYARAPMIAGVPVYLLLAYLFGFALSTLLAISAASARPAGVVVRALGALAWGVPVTAVAWLVSVAPFR